MSDASSPERGDRGTHAFDAAAFDAATLEKVFGLKQRAEKELAEELVRAIGQADRALLPKPATHPMASLLAEGTRAVDKLLDLVERGSDREKVDALDALTHILLGSPSPSASKRLKGALQKAESGDMAALLAKAVALSGDEAFLLQQATRLADDDPAVVASAARLLGFGRYKPAVPLLKGLVSPERFIESRHVIWALGEIGDPSALHTLIIALSNAFRVVDCLIAMGKIGDVTSIPYITPMLVGGTSDERDAAARALAMILDKNRGIASKLDALRDSLAGFVERDLADPSAPIGVSTRFHLCLCLARLGVQLDPARLRKYLGVEFTAGAQKTAGKTRAATSVFNRANAPKVKRK